jgi:hypothetical protein
MPIKSWRSLWWQLSNWTPSWNQTVPAYSSTWQANRARFQAARQRELHDEQRMLIRRRQQRTMPRSRLGSGSRPDSTGVI